MDARASQGSCRIAAPQTCIQALSDLALYKIVFIASFPVLPLHATIATTPDLTTTTSARYFDASKAEDLF